MTTYYSRSYTTFESVPSGADSGGLDTCVDSGGLICSACGGILMEADKLAGELGKKWSELLAEEKLELLKEGE